MFQPGCQTVEKKPPATSENPPVKPAFNGGLSNPGTADPEKAAAADSGLSAPTRPEPGEIIVPGLAPIVPAPVPVIEDPEPINLAPTDVTVYKVSAETPFGRSPGRTTFRLLSYLRAIRPWTRIRGSRLVRRSFCPPEVRPWPRHPRHRLQSSLRSRSG